MITWKTIFAIIGCIFVIYILGAIIGTLAELIDEWRFKK